MARGNEACSAALRASAGFSHLAGGLRGGLWVTTHCCSPPEPVEMSWVAEFQPAVVSHLSRAREVCVEGGVVSQAQGEDEGWSSRSVKELQKLSHR